MPDDEVTVGELGRRMERAFADLKDDIHEIAARLDKKVSQDIYEIKHEALVRRVENAEAELAKRIDAVETDGKEQARKLETSRRWRIGSVVIPIIVLVVGLVGNIVTLVVTASWGQP